VDAQHRFLIAQHLVHIDFLDEQIATVSDQIVQQIEGMPTLPTLPPPTDASADEAPPPLTWQDAADILDTAPGVDQKAAYQVLAEMGINMSQFPTANHLAAWGGLAPGNRQSGGKRFSTRLADGNRQLRKVMVQCAWAAVRTKDSYLGSLYHRLAARRGKKRAIIAVAHSMLVSFYHMLSNRQPYQDLGADYFNQRSKGVRVDWLLKQLTKLGYSAQIEPITAA
jgi:transposase